MKRLSSFLALMILVLTAMVASADSPALDPGRVISEGEFAVLFAREITMKEPEAGFTPDEAIAFLNSLPDPIAPSDGWQSLKPLIEKVMVELVKRVGVFITPSDPDGLVTVAKANVVFRRYVRFFQHFMLYRLQVSNSTDATVLDEGDVTGLVPLSGYLP